MYDIEITHLNGKYIVMFENVRLTFDEYSLAIKFVTELLIKTGRVGY